MEQLRFRLFGTRNYPLKALMVLFLTAVLFILFQASKSLCLVSYLVSSKLSNSLLAMA